MLLGSAPLFANPAQSFANPAQSLAERIAHGEYDAAVTLSAQQPNHYLNKLIQTSRAIHLSSQPVWRALIHYKTSLLGNTTSQVDDPSFFLSKEGKTNPRAELEATLASFFSVRPVAPTVLSSQCRFPARYFWLNSQLKFDHERLSQQRCEKYEEFRHAINANKITVVFPSAHPNSPSSMFGHTLMRFDQTGQTNQTRMLAYSVNYAAIADSGNSLVYAVKGLTGGFIGRFSIIPYYMKLREYAQMENRDIWEYQLNVDQKDIDFILMHAYELATTYFDYYFFTENCSYHLLSLMEVAMPEPGLTEEFNTWVIPVDTLKVLQKRGLISKVTYQPAHNTIIKYRRSLLNSDEQNLALRVFKNGYDSNIESLADLPKERQAPVLDLAYEYQRYDKIAHTDVLEAKLTEQERQLLLARSRLKIKSPPLNIPTPKTRPDQGHETARFTLGIGSWDDEMFTSLGFRAAYHDLLDPSPGYSDHSQLEFFNISARYRHETNKLELEKLRLINIVSLEPRDQFFNNISWHLNVGWDTIPNDQKKRKTIFSLNGGPGITYQIGDNNRVGYVYGFLEAALNYGGLYTSDYIAEAGASTGLLFDFTQKWKGNIAAKYLRGFRAQDTETKELSFKQSLTIQKNLAVQLDISRQFIFDHYYTEFSGKIHFYF